MSDPVTPFALLYGKIDAVILKVFAGAANGMSNYVVPLGWLMLMISLLIYAILLMRGKGASGQEYIGKLFKGIVIILFAGTMYTQYVTPFFFALPKELVTAVAGGASETAPLDALADKLTHLLVGIAQAAVHAFTDWNVGGAITLFISLIAIALTGGLLEVACVFNMIYAKLGIAMLLMVGPFFIICLMWEPTKHWFNSWLNTVMYFTFLGVFSALIMLLFIGIADSFMTALIAEMSKEAGARNSMVENVFSFLVSGMQAAKVEGAAQGAVAYAESQVSILSLAIQMTFTFVPLFLIAMEVRTIVASVTGGSGGSFGSGLVNAASVAWRGGFARHQKSTPKNDK